jgi:hypothetical protein
MTYNFESRFSKLGGEWMLQKQIFLLQNCQVMLWKSVSIEKNSQQIIMNYNATKQAKLLFICNERGIWITALAWVLWINQVICFDEGEENILSWIASILQNHLLFCFN